MIINLRDEFSKKTEFILNKNEFILIAEDGDLNKSFFLVRGSSSLCNLTHFSTLKVIGNKNEYDKFFLLNNIKLKVNKVVETNEAMKILFDSASDRLSFRPIDKISSSNKKTKVLIIDDSATIRKLLTRIINTSSDLEVCAAVDGPESARQYLKENTADIITLDIHMPEMDGVTFFKTFLKNTEIPTVIISSMSIQEGPLVMEALSNGVLAYIEKPEASKVNLVGDEIKAQLRQFAHLEKHRHISINPQNKEIDLFKDSNGIVAIGSSTGGTRALETLLCSFPSEIPSVFIVQHIPEVFSKAFADRLNSVCPFRVKEVENGEVIQKNTVYIAKGGFQFSVIERDSQLIAKLEDIDSKLYSFKPSVDYLFESVLKLGHSNKVCSILTGMGRDGARALLELKNNGAKTLGQNEESCIVYGMPKSAFELGACDQMVHIDDMGQAIIKAYNS
jgi:two-component system chemotaxis response regulator CheB